MGVCQQGKDFMVGGICRVKWGLDDQGWVCQRRVETVFIKGSLSGWAGSVVMGGVCQQRVESIMKCPT